MNAPGEAGRAHDLQRLLEVRLGLAGEAHDDVGGDGGAGIAARTRSMIPR